MSAISDPISDLLVRLRNGMKARLRYVDIGSSKLKIAIVDLLKKIGFVEEYLVKEENGIGTMRIFIKYIADRESILQGLKRISKPGLRRYVKCKDIPYVFNGFGFAILSTSYGVMVDREAKKRGVGGEILCYVW